MHPSAAVDKVNIQLYHSWWAANQECWRARGTRQVPCRANLGLIEFISSGCIAGPCRFTSVQVLSHGMEYECVLQSLPSYPYAVLISKVWIHLSGSEVILMLLTPGWTQSETLVGHSRNPAWTQDHLSLSPSRAEHRGTNDATESRLNPYLQLSISHAESGLHFCEDTRCAGLLSSPDKSNTDQAHPGTRLVQQGWALQPYRARQQLDCIQAHSALRCTRLTPAPDELIRCSCNTHKLSQFPEGSPPQRHSPLLLRAAPRSPGHPKSMCNSLRKHSMGTCKRHRSITIPRNISISIAYCK